MRPCEEYEDLISAFLDGALAEADRARLMEHMASCLACQAYFDDQTAIHDAFLRGEISAPEGFNSAVMEQVRSTPQRAERKRIVLRWQSWAALAACCALAVLGLWRFQSWQEERKWEMLMENFHHDVLITTADEPEPALRSAPEPASVPEPDEAPALTDDASGEEAAAAPELYALPAPTEQKNGAEDAQEEPLSLFETLPEVFLFSSGAGAWRTELHIASDGSFTGEYTDSNAGWEGHPAEQYYCNFSGQFSEPVQVSEFVWSATVEALETEDTPEEISYADGVRRIASTPYGLENAKEVFFFLPGAAAENLPEMFRNWTHAPSEGTLDFYGLYNVEEELGFSGYNP